MPDTPCLPRPNARAAADEARLRARGSTGLPTSHLRPVVAWGSLKLFHMDFRGIPKQRLRGSGLSPPFSQSYAGTSRLSRLSESAGYQALSASSTLCDGAHGAGVLAFDGRLR